MMSPLGVPERNLYLFQPVPKEEPMLWTVFVVLLIMWLLGFTFHVAGGMIHLLLLIAVAVLVINLISGRRTA
jgi:hypothetical protein